MDNHVLELVLFKQGAQLSRESLMEGLRESMMFLQRSEGFLNRQLLYAEERDRWIDLVLWRDSESAARAGEAMMQQPELEPMMRLDEVQMHHLRQIGSSGGVVAAEEISMDSVTEVVVYQLKEGIAEETYLAAVNKLAELISSMDGFMRREVFLNRETGVWAEVIRFRDRETADRIGRAVTTSPEMQQAFGMIAEGSVTMLFGKKVQL